jgi:hypothetical protein
VVELITLDLPVAALEDALTFGQVGIRDIGFSGV